MRKFNLAKKKGLNPTAPIKPDSVKNARKNKRAMMKKLKDKFKTEK